jgi:hypothetical protein
LSKDDYALLKEIEDKEKDKDKDKSKTDEKEKSKDKKPEVKKEPELILDFSGIRDRKAKLTIHSSSLADAVVSKDGEKLFYLAQDLHQQERLAERLARHDDGGARRRRLPRLFLRRQRGGDAANGGRRDRRERRAPREPGRQARHGVTLARRSRVST